MSTSIPDPKQTAYLSSLLPSLLDSLPAPGPRPQILQRKIDQSHKIQSTKNSVNPRFHASHRPDTALSSLDLHPWNVHDTHADQPQSQIPRHQYSKAIRYTNLKTGAYTGYDSLERAQVTMMSVLANPKNQTIATQSKSLDVEPEKRILDLDEALVNHLGVSDVVRGSSITPDPNHEQVKEMPEIKEKLLAPVQEIKLVKTPKVKRVPKPRLPLHIRQYPKSAIQYGFVGVQESNTIKTYTHAIHDHEELTLPESRILNTVTGMPLNALEKVIWSVTNSSFSFRSKSRLWNPKKQNIKRIYVQLPKSRWSRPWANGSSRSAKSTSLTALPTCNILYLVTTSTASSPRR